MTHDLFTVQELVDTIVYLIRGSGPDLRACALVSRSWVHPAQSHLFRECRFTQILNEKRYRPEMWARLKQTLEISPHLISHIRHLNLHIRLDGDSILSSICNFSFTHLEHVEGHFYATMSVQQALDLRQLLSMSTVRQVALTLPRPSLEPDIFPKIFERCSPALRDLELQLSRSPPSLPVRAAGVTTPIPLVSLRLAIHGTLDHRLFAFLQPLSVSQHKALSLVRINDGIVWHELYPVFHRLEFLSVPIQVRVFDPCLALALISVQYTKALDLSQFPHLSYLSLLIMTPQSETQKNLIARLVSTMTPILHIRRLGVQISWMLSDSCAFIDAVMSTIDVPIVEVQVHAEKWAKFFPRLTEKNMVRTFSISVLWSALTQD
jgi:hypothetical protein